MCWDDFHTNFNKLYIGKIFPPTWQQYSISDEWQGNTAGGPYPWPTEENKDQKCDTNDKWFNNPQY